jgi:hypothetical protein
MIDYNARLKELDAIRESTALARDPLSAGLAYFNEKFYEIQSCRDRVLSLLIEAIWNRTMLNSELATLQNEYEAKLSQVLVRDDVKPLKSNELRLAVANNELRPLVDSIKRKEQEVVVADSYYKTVTVIYEELKAKNDNLIQQFLTVRAMLNIEPALKDAVIRTEMKNLNKKEV